MCIVKRANCVSVYKQVRRFAYHSHMAQKLQWWGENSALEYPKQSHFVLDVPMQSLCFSMVDFVLWDYWLQRAHLVERWS